MEVLGREIHVVGFSYKVKTVVSQHNKNIKKYTDKFPTYTDEVWSNTESPTYAEKKKKKGWK